MADPKMAVDEVPPSLAEKAYQMLLDRLLTKKLVPGMLVNRRAIAEELDMSVAPVLEAVIQLQAEGFLETIPRKGTLVRAVHLNSFRGQLLLREALECEAARFYCGKPVIAATDELTTLAMEADISQEETLVELWKAEYAFHTALVRLANCEALTEAYAKVMQRKIFSSAHLFLGGEAFGGGNHVALVKSLQTKDPDRAERVIREHLRYKKEPLFGRVG
jgi:DNA-binding GntR family transcriptional regulator